MFLSEASLAQSGTQEMVHQNIDRFLGGIDHNKGLQMYPWLVYLAGVPQEFLPWSLFWLPLTVIAWQEHRHRFQACLLALCALVVPVLALRLIGGATPEKSWHFTPYVVIALVLIAWTTVVSIYWARRVGVLDNRAKFLVCAVAIPFLFMGLAGSKRNSYLLPIFPFLAVWAAQAWDWVLREAERPDSNRRGLIRAWTVIMSVLSIAAAVFPLGLALTGPLKIQAKAGFDLSPSTVTLAAIVGVVMAIAAVWTVMDLRASRLSRASLRATVLVAAVLLVHEAALRPALDRRADRSAFYAEVGKIAGGRPLVWFGGTANEAVYYCRCTVKRLLAFTEMEDGFFALPNAVMVVRDREFESKTEPSPSLRLAVRELKRLPLDEKTAYYLVEADPARQPLPETLKGKPPTDDGSEGEEG